MSLRHAAYRDDQRPPAWPNAVPEGMMMIDVLHEMLDLTGSRLGCGVRALPRRVVISITTTAPARRCGPASPAPTSSTARSIRTIEGHAQTNDKGKVVALSPVQQTFLD